MRCSKITSEGYGVSVDSMYLFAVLASSTSKTEAADDGDDDADGKKYNDGHEQAEVCIPDRSFRLRHWLLVHGRSFRRQWLNGDWNTQLYFDTSTDKP